jgi:hypothetical protein
LWISIIHDVTSRVDPTFNPDDSPPLFGAEGDHTIEGRAHRAAAADAVNKDALHRVSQFRLRRFNDRAVTHFRRYIAKHYTSTGTDALSKLMTEGGISQPQIKAILEGVKLKE